jgi:hypothetical protein
MIRVSGGAAMTALSPLIRGRPRGWVRPTRASSLVFAGKVAVFRARRLALDLAVGSPRLTRAPAGDLAAVVGRSETPLWSDEALAERALQMGKVQNLRLAARALDGLSIRAGATFSFWRQVGPPSPWRGFVSGRMLQQGCMVPVVGGGLCQLSNALYEAALQAGCEIVERHAHSRIVPGSAAAVGRDATVAWNYVDLRFRSDRDLRLTARLERSALVVSLHAKDGVAAAGLARLERTSTAAAARSCGSCDETDCFLHEGRVRPGPAGRTAFLVDEAWPELEAYVAAARGPSDAFARARRDATAAALTRGLAQRLAGSNAAARRAAALDGAGSIARALARRLTPDVTAVTLAQSYLPYLWRDGCLGGREVSVLMTRLPIAVLQARLDAAAAAHPDRRSLADFRAPAWLAEAEGEALARADRIVTPHAEIAALFGDRAVRLEWRTPPVEGPPVRRPLRRIAFPGPTLARKGAHAVRAAALALDLEVMPLGAELEGAGFWDGVRTLPAGDWRGVDAVVQPALVEDQPRRLLAALAAGLPVIASAACGLYPRPGLTLTTSHDPAALIAALSALRGVSGGVG